ncbi:DUF4335 domain-containing protein [Neosynechococcus sphagnicola]|uniref:DUF4335 domain-containing protein n=1 Tax=Neosynechococcus sphagnicola TaxID=1501145 RepID=UPI00068CB2D2|nr:DUF4335 domain-containing protein [Neosynechococcus sphagnicola]
MTIQRQYSLPNCTLILQGLADIGGGLNGTDVRPVMSVLLNAECRLVGQPRPPGTGAGSFS